MNSRYNGSNKTVAGVADPGLGGYTVCVEQGENMSADGKPVVVRFRATNVFRLIKGEWKMVHHHTDISSQLEAATGIAK